MIHDMFEDICDTIFIAVISYEITSGLVGFSYIDTIYTEIVFDNVPARVAIAIFMGSRS